MAQVTSLNSQVSMVDDDGVCDFTHSQVRMVVADGTCDFAHSQVSMVVADGAFDSTHIQVSMVVADGMVLVRHQGICKHHDAVGQWLYIKCPNKVCYMTPISMWIFRNIFDKWCLMCLMDGYSYVFYWSLINLEILLNCAIHWTVSQSLYTAGMAGSFCVTV